MIEKYRFFIVQQEYYLDYKFEDGLHYFYDRYNKKVEHWELFDFDNINVKKWIKDVAPKLYNFDLKCNILEFMQQNDPNMLWRILK